MSGNSAQYTPTDPRPVLVASDGPARHEVLQVLVASTQGTHDQPVSSALATGRGRLWIYLTERGTEPPDVVHLLAAHEVQAGLWELTYLAFWRVGEDRT